MLTLGGRRGSSPPSGPVMMRVVGHVACRLRAGMALARVCGTRLLSAAPPSSTSFAGPGTAMPACTGRPSHEVPPSGIAKAERWEECGSRWRRRLRRPNAAWRCVPYIVTVHTWGATSLARWRVCMHTAHMLNDESHHSTPGERRAAASNTASSCTADRLMVQPNFVIIRRIQQRVAAERSILNVTGKLKCFR